MGKEKISRRFFIMATASGMAMMATSRRVLGQSAELEWHNVQDWGVEGKGWRDTLNYFDRFPRKAQASVREPVWELSRHAAGMRVQFISDATTIQIRYTLLSARLALPNMPATGVSGLDLYAKDAQGIDRWVSVVAPTNQIMDVPLATEDFEVGRRHYTLYLPLHNSVGSLEIGVEGGTFFEPVMPRTEKPMVFYGTSIMQGLCASRPGIAFPAILGRRLNRPFLNLGFSGNGTMDAEVGALLGELEACVFVIDCLPNMGEELIVERTEPFVRQLREAQPTTPILLVEDRTFPNTPFYFDRAAFLKRRRDAFRRGYQKLLDEGIEQLYYLEGDHLVGHDSEGSTDGTHPNDLGMMRYADAYEPVLRSILTS